MAFCVMFSFTGRRSCVVDATVVVFGNPCRGTVKYMEVDYICTGNWAYCPHYMQCTILAGFGHMCRSAGICDETTWVVPPLVYIGLRYPVTMHSARQSKNTRILPNCNQASSLQVPSTNLFSHSYGHLLLTYSVRRKLCYHPRYDGAKLTEFCVWTEWQL